MMAPIVSGSLWFQEHAQQALAEGCHSLTISGRGMQHVAESSDRSFGPVGHVNTLRWLRGCLEWHSRLGCSPLYRVNLRLAVYARLFSCCIV